MSERIAIVGIGVHPFGRSPRSGLAQGVHAARAALRDAGTDWPAMQFAVGGSVAAGNADSMVADLGLTGLPFVNVVNGCATGGSALSTAVSAIASGAHDVGLVVGFDAHPKGAFDPLPGEFGLPDWYGETGLMLTTQFSGLKIQRYLHDHGLPAGLLSTIAAKAFRNGALNENAWRRRPLGEDDIAAAPMLANPLTRYMFCSPGEGAVALVVCRPSIAHRFTDRPVHLTACALRSRRFGTFEVFSPWLSPDRTPSVSTDAARAAFAAAGVEPGDVDIAQLQDTDAGAELMHLAECGFCEHGEQPALIARAGTGIGGRLPVNTDGGCLANGEPIGASGLRQIHEIVLQLRGDAGPRQVPGTPRVGFTHVYGAPGISACTVLTT